MPHLRLEVPEDWLRDDFIETTGFDACKLLDHLVEVVTGLRMDQPAIEEAGHDGRSVEGHANAPEAVPMIDKRNLKHALIPLHHSGVGEAAPKDSFTPHSRPADTPGRTASVRRHATETLGRTIDSFVGDLPALVSVTVHVVDIDRNRAYSTTADRKRKPEV